jgi:NitT/TauT family transport system substrate-binding protein
MIEMFETPPALPGFDVKLDALASADLMASRLISGEALIGMLPCNTAAKIASSGKDLRIAAVTGLGMFSLLTTEGDIVSLESLKGKKIQMTGHGAVPDYVFRMLLINAGLDPEKDLHLDFSLAYPEIAQSLIAGRVKTAMLPEPFATMAIAGKPDLRAAIDLQKEWARVTGKGNFPVTVLAVDGKFADENPETLKTILSSLESSIARVTSDPGRAGLLVEKFDLGLKAPIVKAAVPKSNYTYQTGREARPALEALFNVIMQFEPESIGGKMPDDKFYY